MNGFLIGNRAVGDGANPFIIAEVAQSHDGNVNFAHAFIDAIASSGADAVKFQTHIAEAETTRAEPWRINFSHQDATRFDYWKRMEWPLETWRQLKVHAESRGLVFLSSAFSHEAVELLVAIGMDAWKVPSGEVGNTPLLRAIASTGRAVLLSSGMSDWEELDSAVAVLRSYGAPFAVFQCTSSYPCKPEQAGLNVLQELNARYGCLVGLSDHSATIYPGLAAIALGASFLEVHVTFHRTAFGPDVSSSVTFEELRMLVEGGRYISSALNHPVDKFAEAERLAPVRALFTKSIVAAHALSAGQTLSATDLICRKPGTGIPAAEWDGIMGRTLAKGLAAGEQLTWFHLDGATAVPK